MMASISEVCNRAETWWKCPLKYLQPVLFAEEFLSFDWAPIFSWIPHQPPKIGRKGEEISWNGCIILIN